MASLIDDVVFGVLSKEMKTLGELCARADGIVHLTASGEASWHGFACCVVEGLKSRGVVTLAVEGSSRSELRIIAPRRSVHAIRGLIWLGCK